MTGKIITSKKPIDSKVFSMGNREYHQDSKPEFLSHRYRVRFIYNLNPSPEKANKLANKIKYNPFAFQLCNTLDQQPLLFADLQAADTT